MTATWQVNDNNDIFARAGGVLAISTDIEAVRDFAEQAIKAQIGEMVYATDRGTNIETELFDGNPNAAAFEASARAALIRIPDITEVVDFSTDFINNELEYRATLSTVFGTVRVVSGGSV